MNRGGSAALLRENYPPAIRTFKNQIPAGPLSMSAYRVSSCRLCLEPRTTIQTGCVFLIEYKIVIMCILSVRGKLLQTNTLLHNSYLSRFIYFRFFFHFYVHICSSEALILCENNFNYHLCANAITFASECRMVISSLVETMHRTQA